MQGICAQRPGWPFCWGPCQPHHSALRTGTSRGGTWGGSGGGCALPAGPGPFLLQVLAFSHQRPSASKKICSPSCYSPKPVFANSPKSGLGSSDQSDSYKTSDSLFCFITCLLQHQQFPTCDRVISPQDDHWGMAVGYHTATQLTGTGSSLHALVRHGGEGSEQGQRPAPPVS